MITFVKKITLTHRISIFASGSGTNAEILIHHFKTHESIHVNAVFTNKESAGVVQVAEQNHTPCYFFSNESFEDGDLVLHKLLELKTDYIVLAGFLRKIPGNIIHAFTERIFNIHPSLLPKHGGKNMYGRKVHEAVLQSGDTETGITIHLVNEEYDKGRILAQFSCPVRPGMSVDDISQAVQLLEHQYYKSTIEKHIHHV
jgi:phosphoribosylglycinamide formyltransferase-1